MKKYLISFIALLWIGLSYSIPAHAFIEFDASSTIVGQTASSANLTFTPNCPSNEMLLIAVGNAVPFTATGVTVNNQNATFLASSTGSRTSGIWYFLNASGAESVTTTFSGNGLINNMIVSSYCGVNQTTPIDATATQSSAATVTTVTGTITTTISNDWIVDTVGIRAPSGTAAAAQTLLFSTGTIAGALSSYMPVTAAGTYNMTWTLPAAITGYGTVLVAIRPAISAGIGEGPALCTVYNTTIMNATL